MDDALVVLHDDSRRKFMPMLANTTFPLTFIEYCGRVWPAPKNYSVALETRFGHNWRVPTLLNRRGTTKDLACRIWMDCGDADNVHNQRLGL
eukprot:gnl/MRDRNA2_/MRDRNA2_132851_c0_seq1.p1 gnl/MRDRNA2_/MRDRNA2_132851_c0~~gnl/MRDRNA2_/MRDRNA2_132851_c0_seq1.p1  ORF type:complete len:107 (+),score=9.45 gnl/MRDRNA2_/MRDRNA2_132851_c0_seq1:47-322(+)